MLYVSVSDYNDDLKDQSVSMWNSSRGQLGRGVFIVLQLRDLEPSLSFSCPESVSALAETL